MYCYIGILNILNLDPIEIFEIKALYQPDRSFVPGTGKDIPKRLSLYSILDKLILNSAEDVLSSIIHYVLA